MSQQSGSSHFRAFFESALQDYQTRAGIMLSGHPLAIQLENCSSVESIAALLQEQARTLGEFKGRDGLIESIEGIVSILSRLSATAVLGDAMGLVLTPVKAIYASLAVLLTTVNGVDDSYDALGDLLELIGRFLKYLDIFTKIHPTSAMGEMMIKVMAELLSTLALATKEPELGQSMERIRKHFGEMDVGAVLQRLDRLTEDEARVTAMPTLEVIYGLFRNMRIITDSGNAAVDDIREALKTLHQITNDKNKLKRDTLQKDIRGWLSPPDPWKNHNIARDVCHIDTGAWFVRGNTFSEWKSFGPSSLIWVHGKPGSGKSVLCSTIIQEIDAMQRSGLASLAFFYHDFRDDQKRSLRGLLSSMLVQLCDQSDPYSDILSDLYLTHPHGTGTPTDDELFRCLKSILELPGQAPIYLIIDALDECPDAFSVPSARKEVLMIVEKLVDPGLLNLRICVTSRTDIDIMAVLEPLAFRSVTIHNEKGQIEDIENYIKSVIDVDRMFQRWKEEDKQFVIEFLTKHADGMFRWVDCQLDYLRHCLPGRIRRALCESPQTLDGTWERMLREIRKEDWTPVHRLLQLVAVAARPLRVDELAEVFALDFNAAPIPKLNEGCLLEDPLEAVLSTCSPLLTVVEFHNSPVVNFSHFSAKEFLTSPRLAENRDPIRRYHISTTPANTLFAKACLGILLHLDENITRDGLEGFPLAEYAAEHWVDHVRSDGASKSVKDGMKQLFDPSKPHFAVWLWIYDPILGPFKRPERPLPPLKTPLHYAAFSGLHTIAKFLLFERSQDVDSRSLVDESTPLHLASGRGYVEITRILVEHGADMTAQDIHGSTPLHWASFKGHLDIARLLVEHGVDVTAQDKHGMTPLHHASLYGHLEVAQFLVQHGADMSAQDEHKMTPLHLTSFNGHVDLARLLVDHGANAIAKDQDEWTPLHHASFIGHVDLARILMEHGADVAAQDKRGMIPLHLAALHGHKDPARLLVDYGADVSAQAKDGMTPLHLAVLNGHEDFARLLMEYGADMSTQAEDGSTPLHLASLCGRVNFARMMLMECGAEVSTRVKDGRTPLHLAALHGHEDLARLLVECGANLSAKAEDGSTPLHLASRWGHVYLSQALVERGADVTAQDKDGSTPLHWASRSGHVDLALLLITHGADSAAQDNGGLTPQLAAAESGHIALARVLTHGADSIPQDMDGSTRLHWSDTESESDHVTLAPHLLGLGADATAQDNDGSIPLPGASESGHADQLRVPHNPSMPAQNMDRWTLLYGASEPERGHVDLTWLDVEDGADKTLQDMEGSPPLNPDLVESKGGDGKLGRSFEYGADVAAPDLHGSTRLHRAAQTGDVDLAQFLVEHGADTTVQDKDGSTPLHWVSQSGHVGLAQLLIEHSANVVAQDNDGSTPLHWASQSRHVEFAQFLVEHGAKVTAEDKNGSTPLHWASRTGHFDLAQFLVDQGADVTARDKDGFTPRQLASQSGHGNLTRFLDDVAVAAQDQGGSTALHQASQTGDLERTLTLLGEGADANPQDANDVTPLHLASRFGHPEIVRALLTRGAYPDSRDESDWTPLHFASEEGHLDVVRLLLDHCEDNVSAPVDLNVENEDHQTPLFLASRNGRLKVAQFLLEHSVDFERHDWSKRTPLHAASRNGHDDVTRLLLEKGASVNTRDERLWTPLHMASKNGKPTVIQLLLDRGAEIGAQNDLCRTPLHMASQEGHFEVVRLLLGYKADVHTVDVDRETALHLAAYYGHLKVSELLLRHYANIYNRNKKGETPFDLASKRGHQEVARLLSMGVWDMWDVLLVLAIRRLVLRLWESITA